MNDRHFQLQWYGGDIIAQDHELKTFIADLGIASIRYQGDCDHTKSVIGMQGESTEFCVYMVNKEFSFKEVAENCVGALEQLDHNGILYLALNKFLARPEPWKQASGNYDMDILYYMTKHVPYVLIKYHSGHNDGGQRFNWIHPLTRFYFANASIK